jgi:archaellum component FlaC
MNEKEFHDALEFPQKNGELFWKKLLQSQDCKNEEELLRKGTILADNPYFVNAIKNAADDNERAKYESIKTAQEKIAKTLLQELDKKEPEEKRATKVEELLPKLKEELNAAEIKAQESLAELEKIEKAIQEQIIDCGVVAGEYLHALEDIHKYVGGIGDKSKSEITVEEKTLWEGQLELFAKNSEAELEKSKKLKSEHPKFKEFFDLTEKHRTATVQAEIAISKIKTVQSNIESLVNAVEGIKMNYARARNVVNDGNFILLQEDLLPHKRFDEIVNQVNSTLTGGN